MDQSLKTASQSVLENAFHLMFGLSRTEPAPTLNERLDRLARLRAAPEETGQLERSNIGRSASGMKRVRDA